MADAEMLRLLLGNPSDDVISDDVLDVLLVEYNDLNSAIAEAANVIANHFALKADKALGDRRTSYAAQSAAWRQYAERAEKRAFGLSKPFFGGTSRTQKELERDDPERLNDDFWRGWPRSVIDDE